MKGPPLCYQLKELYEESRNELKWDLTKRKARTSSFDQNKYNNICNIKCSLTDKEYFKQDEDSYNSEEQNNLEDEYSNINVDNNNIIDTLNMMKVMSSKKIQGCNDLNLKTKIILPLEVLDHSKKKPVCYENNTLKYSIHEEFDKSKFNFGQILDKVKPLKIKNDNDYIIVNAFPSIEYSLLYLPEVLSNHSQYINDERFLTKSINLNFEMNECFYYNDMNKSHNDEKPILNSDDKRGNHLNKVEKMSNYKAHNPFTSRIVIGYNSKGATSSVNHLHFQIFYLDEIDENYDIIDYSVVFKVIDKIKCKENEKEKGLINREKDCSDSILEDESLKIIDENYEITNHKIKRKYFKKLLKVKDCNLKDVDLSSSNEHDVVTIYYNYANLSKNIQKNNIHNNNNGNKNLNSNSNNDCIDVLGFYYIEYDQNAVKNIISKRISTLKDNKISEDEQANLKEKIVSDLNNELSNYLGKEAFSFIKTLNENVIPYNIILYENFIAIVPRKHDLLCDKYCVGILELIGAYICYSQDEYDELDSKKFLKSLGLITIGSKQLSSIFQAVHQTILDFK